MGRKIKNFQASSVNPNDVPFKDRKQEKLRQQRWKEQQQEAEQPSGDWEADDFTHADEKAEKKKELDDKERTRSAKRVAGRKGRAEEWKLLQAEESLAKKMRKGTITADDFATGLRKAARKLKVSDDEAEGLEEDEDLDDSDADSSDGDPVARRNKNNGAPRTAL